jgi:ectoine hydroxylase-related dioxygenase (phytanoyl-CoA dioxygenase family)
MSIPEFTVDEEVQSVIDCLRLKGAAIVHGLIGGDALVTLYDELRRILDCSPLGRHELLGLQTRRTGRLLAQTRSADALIIHPFVLGVVEGLIGEVLLSGPSAIELLPGEETGHWHHDGFAYPLTRPHPDVLCNVLVAIDRFEVANGATRVVLGSNHWGTARPPREREKVLVAEMPAGSALFLSGTTMHSAGTNNTDRSRIALGIEFAAAWLRPQETLTLSVPPAIAVHAPPRLRELMGYSVTQLGIGHVGGEYPSVVFDALDGS